MSLSRVLISLFVLVAALFVAGCASTPSEQAATTQCKVAVADFAGKPARNVSTLEQDAAEMRLYRLGYARGSYRGGQNVFMDAAHDCY
jgi:hypothetical protein